MAQQVKDLALSLLWHGFNPWPQNFPMPQAQGKKKKKDEIIPEGPEFLVLPLEFFSVR